MILLLLLYHLLSGAEFSAAAVDFVQVGLDGLQVGGTITTTQLQNQLQTAHEWRAPTQKVHETAG